MSDTFLNSSDQEADGNANEPTDKTPPVLTKGTFQKRTSFKLSEKVFRMGMAFDPQGGTFRSEGLDESYLRNVGAARLNLKGQTRDAATFPQLYWGGTADA
jgi:hypothetical protein